MLRSVKVGTREVMRGHEKGHEKEPEIKYMESSEKECSK
jgi:hypothetical protein